MFGSDRSGYFLRFRHAEEGFGWYLNCYLDPVDNLSFERHTRG